MNVMFKMELIVLHVMAQLAANSPNFLGIRIIPLP